MILIDNNFVLSSICYIIAVNNYQNNEQPSSVIAPKQGTYLIFYHP